MNLFFSFMLNVLYIVIGIDRHVRQYTFRCILLFTKDIGQVGKVFCKIYIFDNRIIVLH